MMMFTRSRGRINVDRDIGKVWQMVQELMTDFSRNLMTLFDCKIRLYGDIDVGQEPMSNPADPDFCHLQNFRHMVGRMRHLVNDFRINPIQQASTKRLSRLPNDLENDACNDKADNWISLGIPQPYTNRSKKHP